MSTETPTLTKTQRQVLTRTARAEAVGGLKPRFIAIVHKDLEAMGLLYVNGTRVRCTPEGLEAAGEIREREDAA